MSLLLDHVIAEAGRWDARLRPGVSAVLDSCVSGLACIGHKTATRRACLHALVVFRITGRTFCKAKKAPSVEARREVLFVARSRERWSESNQGVLVLTSLRVPSRFKAIGSLFVGHLGRRGAGNKHDYFKYVLCSL